jgi:hypothetical protein
MTTNNQGNNYNGLENEEVLKTLERINFWINNCDTKISFALAFAGVIIAGFFSSSIITNKLEKLIKEIFNIDSSTKIMEIVLLILSLLVIVIFITCMITAITTLFIALKGSVDTSKFREPELTENSLIYFGSVANQPFQSFKHKAVTNTGGQIYNDYLSQVYINSKVCEKKFKLLNRGIKYLISSIYLFILLNILFLFIK